MKKNERYNLTAVTDVRDAAGLIFYRPLRGVMSVGFSPEKRHFGIDLTASLMKVFLLPSMVLLSCLLIRQSGGM